MTEETWKALRGYLERLGAAEYAAFKQTKEGKKKNARYQPTEYHAELVRLLGEGDEEGFKALKALQGPHSALGV